MHGQSELLVRPCKSVLDLPHYRSNSVSLFEQVTSPFIENLPLHGVGGPADINIERANATRPCAVLVLQTRQFGLLQLTFTWGKHGQSGSSRVRGHLSRKLPKRTGARCEDYG